MRRRRAPAPRKQEQRTGTLTLDEEQLLQRLLSDPTKYPQPLKTWIISWLEGSDLSLPMYSVNGLKDRLNVALPITVLSGYTSGNTDANGNIRVNFATPVSSVGGVVVSRQGGKPPDPPLPQMAPSAVLSVQGIDVNGFLIFAWHMPTQTPLANYGIQAVWIAHVVP